MTKIACIQCHTINTIEKFNTIPVCPYCVYKFSLIYISNNTKTPKDIKEILKHISKEQLLFYIVEGFTTDNSECSDNTYHPYQILIVQKPSDSSESKVLLNSLTTYQSDVICSVSMFNKWIEQGYIKIYLD